LGHALRAGGSSAQLRFDGRVVVVTGAGINGSGSSSAPADEVVTRSHGIRVNAIAPRAFTRMSASHSDALADFMGMPKEMMEQINASMPPEMCSPAVAFLAHESCPLNGKILQVGMGGVSRIAVVHTSGITKTPITGEDIAGNIDAIMDAREARVTDTLALDQL
jgi:hypothetical protein